MNYKCFYKTPEGFSDIWINSDGKELTGLWFDGTKDEVKHSHRCEGDYTEIQSPHFSDGLSEAGLKIFDDTKRWLDIYFSGQEPDFTPDYKINNATPFRLEVIKHMLEIPYGKTVTYGSIAEKIAAAHGIKKMSSRAVGGAVGWNPIGIIIPCHRVIGAGGSLTGYGGGIENKISLLKLERWL